MLYNINKLDCEHLGVVYCLPIYISLPQHHYQEGQYGSTHHISNAGFNPLAWRDLSKDNNTEHLYILSSKHSATGHGIYPYIGYLNEWTHLRLTQIYR
jgi:hypothetical protein